MNPAVDTATPRDPTRRSDLGTVTIHGARGSFPVSGQAFQRYGGCTSCFSLETPHGLLIVDAGTGLAALGDELAQRAALPPITILLTHLHLDHVIGIPTFKPLARRDARVTFMADAACLGDWQSALKRLIAKPFWPVDLEVFGATVEQHDLPTGGFERYSIAISSCPVRHPQGCVSYRLDYAGRAIVIATDREAGDPTMDATFLAWCRGADVLIHDGQYTPQESADRRGWGHSTWEQAARAAAAAGVGQLVLVSHDPRRTDAQVDALIEQTRRLFAMTVGGAERMVVR